VRPLCWKHLPVKTYNGKVQENAQQKIRKVIEIGIFGGGEPMGIEDMHPKEAHPATIAKYVARTEKRRNWPRIMITKAIKTLRTMAQEKGIWVHLGKIPEGLDWDELVDAVREERLKDATGL
jgi:hypothetical protein